jgi:O-antigen/teichoic acid export membrane protein
LLVAALVPRFLGDRVLGEYTLATTVATLVGYLMLLGVPGAVTRRIAVRPERATLEGPAALLLLTVLSAIIGGALTLIMPILGLDLRIDILRLAIVAMVASTGSAILAAVLNGQHRFARASWVNAGTSVLSGMVSLAILAAGGDVVLAMVGVITATVAVSLFGWYTAGFRPSRLILDVPLWRALIVAGLPFLGWDLALRIYGEIDKVILAMISPATVVGWYAAAIRITSIPIFIPTLIATPLLPVLSRHAGDVHAIKSVLRRSVLVVLVLTVPLSAGLIVLAPRVPELLGWDAAFLNSVPLLVILAFQQPIVGVDMVLGTALFALSREKRWLWVAVIATVFNPGLNLLLVPYFEQTQHNGAIGAAIVTVATDLLMLTGGLILLPRAMFDLGVLSAALRIVVAGLCLVGVMLLVNGWWLPVQIAAGGLAYIGCVVALRVLSSEDLRHAHAIVQQRMLRRGALV